MYVENFDAILEKIDSYNSEDPNQVFLEGSLHPAEWLYGKRMYEMALALRPNAEHEVLVAARAQHIQRWKIARFAYPQDREGYLRWRNDLKKMHAIIITDVLQSLSCEDAFIDRVVFLVQKKDFKRNKDSQLIEDAACLVFLIYYFDKFAAKTDEDKMLDIIRKTWDKMSDEAKSMALSAELSELTSEMVGKALNG